MRYHPTISQVHRACVRNLAGCPSRDRKGALGRQALPYGRGSDWGCKPNYAGTEQSRVRGIVGRNKTRSTTELSGMLDTQQKGAD